MRTGKITPRLVGMLLFAAIGSAFAISLGVALAAPSHTHGEGTEPGGPANPPGTVLGTTEGWLDGRTVTFFYTRPFFCQEPPSSSAESGCEVGESGTAPVGNPDIPEVWVLVPLGFTPPAGTLQCPVAGNCVAHPHDIDLSRVFGPDAADVPTPAHSHVIDDLQGGWWEGFVVGVKTQEAWDRIVAGKSIAAVREVQAEGLATGDIPTNLFLFFNVLPLR